MLRLLIVIGIMLLVPQVCRKIHLPAIVGFILAGMAIGPYGINLLGDTPTVNTLGQMGMLYIMLQSGIEIDMNDFSRYRQHAFVFGLLSFLLPFWVGYLTSRLLLSFTPVTSVLMGAMYGSHTLMTYPILGRYGVQKNRAVNIVVGATMLAISLSLIVLAVVKATQGEWSWLSLPMMALFLIVVLWGIPVAAQAFLKRVQEPIADFTFVMCALVFSAWLADVAGLEAILGAFLCGVALNRHVPNSSKLMNNINLVGTAVFVPLFLLGVGFLIDVRVFFSGTAVWWIAGVMLASKLLGKWLAAWLGQQFFHLTGDECELCFGLTHAAAAGTLAVVTVGFHMGLLSPLVLNATVIMILLLCTLSSFVTEHAAKNLALAEEARLVSDRDEDEWIVFGEQHEQQKELALLAELREPEFVTTNGWTEITDTVEHSHRSMVVYHQRQPLQTIQRILVAVPRYAEKEHDFISCFGLVRRLSSEIGARVVFFATEETQIALRALCNREGKYLKASFHEMTDWEDVLMVGKEVHENDMVVMVSARRSTVSYNPLFEQIPSMLDRFFPGYSWLLVYPEQGVGTRNGDHILMDIPQASRTWSLVTSVKQFLLRQFRRLQH